MIAAPIANSIFPAAIAVWQWPTLRWRAVGGMLSAGDAQLGGGENLDPVVDWQEQRAAAGDVRFSVAPLASATISWP